MDRIVVGVDGSEASKAALRWGLQEAKVHGATLIALHAYESTFGAPDVSPAPGIDVVGDATQTYEAAVQFVTRIVDEVAGGDSNVRIEALAVEGLAPETVLIDASRDASLLVVGSRGHGELAEVVLGSVSLECVHHAACPVVVHRGS
jgi:nucleotide-binding universal stress UspA family protein